MEHPETPPPLNTKQIKRMMKKLGKLNKKIRHANKKHNDLVSKQNSIKKKIEELKGPCEPESFNPVVEQGLQAIEHEQAFGRAYRSYRINGRPIMDTIFYWIRQNLIDLISRELTDLNSVSVQTNTWIRFRIEHEEGIVDRVRLPFNRWMTDIFRGNDLNEIDNGMFTHMKTQIENPALANSRFVFDEVLFMDIIFHQLNLTRGSSYLLLPDWVSRKGGVINPQNLNDEECFKWAVIAGLHYLDIRSHREIF